MESSFAKFSTRFNMLPAESKTTIAEYIWIGGSGFDLRSKTMCIPKICKTLEDFPTWNFDGSSTGQAQTEDSEVVLKPVYFCIDPFRLNPSSERETFNSDGITPAKANFRYYARKIFNETANEKPWFGFEQEYILLKYEGTSSKWPMGFPKGGFPNSQGQYYCSVGSTNAIGRYVAEAHMKCCLAAGLMISGINGEVFPGQWEFQIGPAESLKGCDQLWMARYILTRICEEFDVEVTFEPKPVEGEWNGSGCHANISFESTRKERGYDRIIEAMESLSKRHKEHITVYGKHNELRLTGSHETASLNEFRYGAGDRGASVRIPNKTVREKKGYFEDRRPSSNCDPYLVGGMLADTAILKIKYGDEMLGAFKSFLNE